MAQGRIRLVNVFTHQGQGGNPCPIVIDAAALQDEDMRAVAARYGHESGFVRPPSGPDSDFTFRFWVPRHEAASSWVRVRLAALDDEQELTDILTDSWRLAAPPRLTEQEES